MFTSSINFVTVSITQALVSDNTIVKNLCTVSKAITNVFFQYHKKVIYFTSFCLRYFSTEQ